MACRPACRGFTLVELVVVITVLGILAFGTVSFITNSSQSYQQAAVGDRLGSSARIVVDRLSRELRGALPNSVRTSVGGSCVEWVPIVAAGTYLELARGSLTSMPVVPLFEPPQLTGSSARVSVYPISTPPIYDLGGPPAISNALTDLAISASNPASSAVPVQLNFSTPPGFAQDSPQRRWFLVEDPVSFCVINGNLYRYQNYGYIATQLAPPTGGERWLLANEVFAPSACGAGNSDSFRVAPATLQRNALILLDLCFLNPQGGNLQVVHEVQLRNVP